MSDNIHEPIVETTNPGEEVYQFLKKKYQQVVIGGGALVALALASTFLQTDYWKGLIYTTPLTILVAWLAIILYPKQSVKKIKMHGFELEENGIYQQLLHPDIEEVELEQAISRSLMKRIMIRNFVRQRDNHLGLSIDHHQFDAIMLIDHDGGRSTKR